MIALANLGYKTYAPFLRGFVPTRFLDANTHRSGNTEFLGQDAIDFFDALALKNAIIVGQDWGSAIAEILTFSRPDRHNKQNWKRSEFTKIYAEKQEKYLVRTQ